MREPTYQDFYDGNFPTDREQFVRVPDACGSGDLLPRSKADSLEHVYTAFRLWEASLIFPRKLVKPPVYKGFSICYNFCTFPPPAFGNTDVCIPQGFLLLKGLFSPANTTHPHQPEPKPWQFLRRGNGVGTVLLLGCCKSLLTHFSIPQRLHYPHALPTLKSDKSSKNTI